MSPQNPKLQSALLSRNNSTSTRGSVPSDSEFRQAYDQWKHLQIQARGAQLPQGAGGAPAHMRRSPLSPLTDMEKEVRTLSFLFHVQESTKHVSARSCFVLEFRVVRVWADLSVTERQYLPFLF